MLGIFSTLARLLGPKPFPAGRPIAIVNKSTIVQDSDFQAYVAAQQRQINEHFAPAWGLSAVLKPAAKVPTSGEVLIILDTSDQADALGYHELSKRGDPIGFAFAKTSQADGSPWQVTASHEVLEQLADPWIYAAAAATWNGRPAAVALETADPVEADVYKIDGVPLSNFVFPTWFGGIPASKYDYLGKCKKPLTMTPGGYVSYTYNLKTWQQSFMDGHNPAIRTFTRKHRRHYEGRMR